MCASNQLEETLKDKVGETLLQRHRHLNEKPERRHHDNGSRLVKFLCPRIVRSGVYCFWPVCLPCIDSFMYSFIVHCVPRFLPKSPITAYGPTWQIAVIRRKSR
ncbi:hypothetical protein DPMN_067743 [Dreissena polymorpha]|uniref:Uncharacterized protein n=1 Tax=Dreissena polymorpha TaxID=45954 RepID=A0A9D3YZR9_DREPO|nr:hypothetical protein DPMN_067743 [Dreissena polymorpha]